MNGKTVYIETTVVSYLTAQPSKDLHVAAWQSATLEWWNTQRHRFDLHTSEVVLDEAARGDRDAADRRLNRLAGIPLLTITESARDLAKALVRDGAVPDKAIDDALHIAISAVHAIDYLLTWNFRHLDNAEMKPLIRSVCVVAGYACPEICTPQELMGANHYD